MKKAFSILIILNFQQIIIHSQNEIQSFDLVTIDNTCNIQDGILDTMILQLKFNDFSKIDQLFFLFGYTDSVSCKTTKILLNLSYFDEFDKRFYCIRNGCKNKMEYYYIKNNMVSIPFNIYPLHFSEINYSLIEITLKNSLKMHCFFYKNTEEVRNRDKYRDCINLDYRKLVYGK